MKKVTENLQKNEEWILYKYNLECFIKMNSSDKLFEEKLGVFTKSLPDHGLGLNGSDDKGNLIIKQTLDDVFQNLDLQPNTKSFGLEERLSYSFLHEHQVATGLETSYRNNGILFNHRDGDKQDIFMPADLLSVTKCDNLPTKKNEVLNNILQYYSHDIIDTWKLLGSADIKTSMSRLHQLKLYLGDSNLSDNELLLTYINDYRESQGYQPLTVDHKRMLSYNECIKFTPLKVNIIGVYGVHHNIIEKSKNHNIPHYITLQDYLDTIKK